METGELITTIGINEAIKSDEIFENELRKCWDRYINLDWGEIDDYDKSVNEEALEIGERIFAKYETTKGDIFIITERDRSCTTILFANEY